MKTLHSATDPNIAHLIFTTAEIPSMNPADDVVMVSSKTPNAPSTCSVSSGLVGHCARDFSNKTLPGIYVCFIGSVYLGFYSEGRSDFWHACLGFMYLLIEG